MMNNIDSKNFQITLESMTNKYFTIVINVDLSYIVIKIVKENICIYDKF